jgi:ferredoxin-NADP reductase
MKDLQIWVDNILGRVTMYRLVVYGLSAIAVFAFTLMLTGYLSFSPAGFVVSIIVCVSVSYAANRLLGWLFGLHPHSESAIITGLILALLFTPPTTPLAMIKIILVVVIANLSKYVLVIRSKHIFNPAAIGIVIAGASGLAFASWWIGSPGLLAVTIIVAGLILYKTEKMQLGLTFLTVSVIMIGLLSVSHGTFTLQNLSLAFTSWPLVFFAGIMLCEPLTMAPRKTQQIGIAVLIGILLPLDFHYGKLSMTPALALVIGNAVAFWFSIQRTVKLRLASTKKQGSDGYELSFDVAPFAYLPGQYIELTLPHRHADSRGMRRVFSIVGVPNDHQLGIATRIPEKPSTFKKALIALKPGKVVYGTRVAGDFVLPDDIKVPIVCIAGGIGITPFISFLEAGGKRPLTIVYSVKSITDLMFVDRLRQYNVNVIVVSEDETTLPDRDWIHKREVLNQAILSEYVTPESHVYISGPPAMVTNVKQLARNAGALSVHTDSFSGY